MISESGNCIGKKKQEQKDLQTFIKSEEVKQEQRPLAKTTPLAPRMQSLSPQTIWIQTPKIPP